MISLKVVFFWKQSLYLHIEVHKFRTTCFTLGILVFIMGVTLEGLTFNIVYFWNCLANKLVR